MTARHKTRTVLTLVVVAILGLMTPSAHAGVIYSESFSDSGDLNGTTLDVTTGGATWLATVWNKDGTFGGDAVGNAFLPFTPEAGKVYTLSATLSVTGGRWLAFGFTRDNVIDIDFWQNGGTAWVLLRDTGVVDSWSGDIGQGGTNPGVGGKETLDTISGSVDLLIVLDTRDAQWTVEWAVNGISKRTFTYTTGNPTDITHVGFGGLATTVGTIDDFLLQIPETALASAPNPEDGQADVLRDSGLSWTPGIFAVAHDVYLGESFEDVNQATVPTAAGLDVNSLDPGRMALGQTYYWRVNEVNAPPDNTVHKGEVWRFEVEPYSIPIPGAGIAVTASSSSNEFSTPDKTIDGSGLDAHGAHDIGAETMWFTAAVDPDPWIQYEFDSVKKLDSMTVWNSNGAAEAAIGWGVKDVEIAISVDGETWDILADANQFSRAPGLPTYDQYDTIDFGGAAAKVVRLNIQSNWGGVLMSYGLSEVKFSAIPVRARTPEPASESVDILPDSILTWRTGRDTAEHVIYVDTDANAVADGTAASVLSNTNSFDTTSLDLELGQTYYWRVDEVNEAEAVTAWAGPVWRFSTRDVRVVDDFESYGNQSPDRPFQTWLDGIGYSADEFFPVAYGGNGTGAAIGHDIWSLSSPHYNGTIMETAIVSGGSQSMPFYYSNAASTDISEATRRFTAPQNWARSGIKGLRLSFFGDPANAATQMYVKINGTQIDYDGEAADIQQKPWHRWYVDLIDLAGVNLEAVTELTLGFKGGQGVVYFDDIVLTPQAREWVTPVAPSDTGLVVQYAFEGNAADSAGANSGTLEGAPEFVAGQNGQALRLDGVDDFVTVEGSFDLATYSASLWFRVEGGTGARDLISMYDSSGAFGVLLELQADGTLRYLKRPLGTTGDNNLYTTSPFDDGAWTHVAIVKSPDAITLFVNGESVGSSADTTSYDAGALHRITLGVLRHDALQRYFPGDMDDFNLYDRVLSQDEIAWLAGRTGPFDK